VDDHQRDLLAGDAVGGGRGLAEPVGQQHQEREAQQRHETELDVEEEQDASGADQRQRGGDQAVEAGLEHLVDRVDVGGLARDDPAGGVGVVELRVKGLEVSEDPAAQRVQDVLADAPLHHQEPVARDRLGQRRAEHERHHGGQRGEVVVGADRRDAGVDADLDEVGDGEPGDVLDQHDEHEQLQRPGVRRQQLVGVDGGLAAPRPGVLRGAHAGTPSVRPVPLGPVGPVGPRSASAARSSR
jgi:hypothetical protein